MKHTHLSKKLSKIKISILFINILILLIALLIFLIKLIWILLIFLGLSSRKYECSVLLMTSRLYRIFFYKNKVLKAKFSCSFWVLIPAQHFPIGIINSLTYFYKVFIGHYFVVGVKVWIHTFFRLWTCSFLLLAARITNLILLIDHKSTFLGPIL